VPASSSTRRSSSLADDGIRRRAAENTHNMGQVQAISTHSLTQTFVARTFNVAPSRDGATLEFWSWRAHRELGGSMKTPANVFSSALSSLFARFDGAFDCANSIARSHCLAWLRIDIMGERRDGRGLRRSRSDIRSTAHSQLRPVCQRIVFGQACFLFAR
jgi:hypothetical protein